LVYAGSGRVNIQIIEANGRQGIEILAEDKGPGIANLDRALTDGFSSARGLGMGLPGTKRLMDEFYIESNLGMGTQVVARKWLD
jgi:serine/threonine-protein kinase RsbT